jgi:hypothetical protein
MYTVRSLYLRHSSNKLNSNIICACRSEKEKVKFQQEVYELLAQVEAVTKDKVSLTLSAARIVSIVI